MGDRNAPTDPHALKSGNAAIEINNARLEIMGCLFGFGLRRAAFGGQGGFLIGQLLFVIRLKVIYLQAV